MLNKIKNNNGHFWGRIFDLIFDRIFETVAKVTAYSLKSVQFAKGFSAPSLSSRISMPLKRQASDTASMDSAWSINGFKAYIPSIPQSFRLSSSPFNRRSLNRTSAAQDVKRPNPFYFKNSSFNAHLLNVGGEDASLRTFSCEMADEMANERKGQFTSKGLTREPFARTFFAREDFLSPCFDSRYCAFPFRGLMDRYCSHYDGLLHERSRPMERMLTGQSRGLSGPLLNHHPYHDYLCRLTGFHSMEPLFDLMGEALLAPELELELELESKPERKPADEMSAVLLAKIQNQAQTRSGSMFASDSLEDFTQKQELQINANARENVDNVTGQVQACQLEFSLAGFIPLSFKRVYCSAWHHESVTEPKIQGLLGRTWWCSWDLCLVIESGQLCFIDEGKQKARFAFPLEGQEVRSASLPAWRLKRFQGRYYMRHVSGLTYGFHVTGFNVNGAQANGANRLLLSEIVDENKNSIHFIYEKGLLTWVLLSDDRYIKVVTEQACITKLVLTDSKKRTIAPLVDFTYNAVQQLIVSHAHGRHQAYYDYDKCDHLLKTASGIEAVEEKTDSPVPSDFSWVQYRYDDKGRAVSRLGAQGLGRGQWRYDDDNAIIYHKTSHKGIVCYHRNAQKQLVKWINAKGGVTSFEWRGGQLSRQIDPLGQYTAWEYDDWGQVCAIKQSDNRVHRYGFNAQGKLVSALDSEGNTWQYHYDKKGNRTQACLPCGDRFYYQYSGRGQLAWIVKQDGEQLGFQYHIDSQVSAVYLPERIEKVSAQSDQRNQNELGEPNRLDQDANAQYQKITDTLLFEYDDLGRLISQHWQTEMALMKTQFKRVQLDRKAGGVFDLRGLSVSSLLMQKPFFKRKTQDWTYDGVSMRPARWTTFMGDRTIDDRSFQYSHNAHLIKVSIFAAPKAELESELGAEVEAGSSLVNKAKVNKANFASKNQANEGQAPRSQKAFPCRIYRFTYGAFGCLRHYESTKTSSEKSKKREKVQLGYDGQGQLMGMKSETSHWCYRFNASGERSDLVYGDGLRVQYEYDALGRLVQRTGLDGTQLRFYYDALGRLIQKQALSGAVVMSNTFFNYNAQSQLLSVNSDDVRGRKMRVEYRLDPKGKVIGESIHEGMSQGAKKEPKTKDEHTWRGEYLSSSFFQQAGCEHKALIRYFSSLRQRHLAINAIVKHKALCVFEREPINLQQRLLQNMESLLMNQSPLSISNEAISNKALSCEIIGSETIGSETISNEVIAQEEHDYPLINKRYANSVQNLGHVTYRFDVCGRMIEKVAHDPKLSAKQTRFIWDEEDKLMAVLLPTGDSWRCHYDGLARLIDLEHISSQTTCRCG
ncbi:DUF6531 domain-containing protein [uncultured Shewanella sp.]|uniref:DUF6531 domain-containing protein n=1 Tax=uncultured Shewanella sp. TaxID=173975 RepID=UPI0026221184|nr:DUF6531 domain-containing protein [uncultured Shewanella sp.]